MVFEFSQRGFLLLEISLGGRGGQSLLSKSSNELVLLLYALLAIRDELGEQRRRLFVSWACHDRASCSSCEALSWQVSCGCVFRMAELSSSSTAWSRVSAADSPLATQSRINRRRCSIA